MITAESLLQVRVVDSSNNYSCPKHISTDACLALFREAGVEPEAKAVGRLGDVIENFALALIGSAGNGAMSVREFEARVQEEFPST